jgi:hypothetical protein
MTEDTQVLNIQEELLKQVAGLKATVAPPTGFIVSTKNKQFTLPDGRQSDGPLDCIVLDHVSANLYYSGAYDAKALTSPDCFAIGRVIDDMAPSANAPTQQDESCGDCAFNQWGSATNGGKGKACKNTRKLLVVPADAEGDNVQQYVLNVSPSGIKHYDKYIDMLASSGKHPIQVVTAISFDANEAYPSLRFAVKEPNPEDRVALMWNLRESGESLLLQEPVSDKAA